MINDLKAKAVRDICSVECRAKSRVRKIVDELVAEVVSGIPELICNACSGDCEVCQHNKKVQAWKKGEAIYNSEFPY